MLTFDQGVNLLNNARYGQKKVANNTYLYQKNDDTLAVKLYATDVVLIHKDGTYTLNSGHYQTLTTKTRINDFSPANIYQKKYVWYVGDNIKFKDGIKIDQTGKVA